MLRTSIVALSATAILSLGTSLCLALEKTDEQGNKHCQGRITKVDAQKDTVSIKSTDKDGKEKEQTLQLTKDAKLLDAEGKDVKLDSFKAGDEVCLTEKNDKVTKIRKHMEAKITKVDAKAGTITVKMQDKNGKDTERTFRLVEDTEYIDSTGRIAVLDVFQSGDDILFVEADGKITGMKKSDHQKNATAAKQDSEKKPEKK